MLDDKLKEWQTDWNIKQDYSQDAIPEVYAYYKKFVEAGKYPYLSQVVDFIADQETIGDKAALKTQVYLASHQYKRELDSAHRAQMLADGWLELNGDTAKKLHGQKVSISADGQGAIFSFNLSDIYKVFVNDKGYAYLMKPRATRKGYLISNLENAFYKLV